MRIKMIRTLSTGRETFKRGKEYDLDIAEAESAVRNGVAVPAEPVEEPKPVEAQPVRGKARKAKKADETPAVE